MYGEKKKDTGIDNFVPYENIKVGNVREHVISRMFPAMGMGGGVREADLDLNNKDAKGVKKSRHSTPDGVHAGVISTYNPWTADVMQRYGQSMSFGKSALSSKNINKDTGGSGLRKEKISKRKSFVPYKDPEEEAKQEAYNKKLDFNRMNHPNSIQSSWAPHNRQSIEDYKKSKRKRSTKPIERPRRSVMPKEPTAKLPQPRLTIVINDIGAFVEEVSKDGRHVNEILLTILQAKKFTEIAFVKRDSYQVEYDASDVAVDKKKHEGFIRDMSNIDLRYSFEINRRRGMLCVKCSSAWRERNFSKQNTGDMLWCPILFCLKYEGCDPDEIRVMGKLGFRQEFGSICNDMI